MLHELITGRLPRSGASLSGVDARWRAIILRCLAGEPAARPESAADVAEALVGPPTRRRRAATTASLALLLVLIAVVALRPTGEAPPPLATPPQEEGQPVVAVLGFRSLSGRAEDAWLSTAIAETLSADLALGPRSCSGRSGITGR